VPDANWEIVTPCVAAARGSAVTALDAPELRVESRVMPNRRSIAFLALVAVVLGACQATASPIATRSPGTTAAGATEGTLAADCAALHWYDVRSALESTDHYTYGSVDHIVSDPPTAGSVSPPSEAFDRVALGTYLAPDRMREVSTWTLAAPAPSGAPFRSLAPLQYPDFIQIGMQGWERIPLAGPLWHPGLRMLDQRGGHVATLLRALAASAPWSVGSPFPTVPNGPTECVLTDDSVTGADGTRFEASLWADPATALPTRLRIDRVGRTGYVSHFEMTIYPTAGALIEPPAANEMAAGSPGP
jgi:hypothetical protein